MHQQLVYLFTPSNGLTRVEEKIRLLVYEYNTGSLQSGQKQYLSLILNSKIPDLLNWTVKMWRFGRDALTIYSGEKFDIIWEDCLNVLHHIYSKDLKKQ